MQKHAESEEKKPPGLVDGYQGTGVPENAKVSVRKREAIIMSGAKLSANVRKLLNWTECGATLQQKGFLVINFQLRSTVAIMKLNRAYMEKTKEESWKPNLPQPWSSGRRLNLKDITSEFSPIKMELPHLLINTVRAVRVKMSIQVHPGFKQVFRLSYLTFPPGQHKQELLHADRMVQGNMMALMALNKHAVTPNFYSYGNMQAKAGQDGPELLPTTGDITNSEKIRSAVAGLQKHFRVLSDTTSGADALYGSLEAPGKIGVGDMLVYFGDALHAMPAGTRTQEDRFLCFRGNLEKLDAKTPTVFPNDYNAVDVLRVMQYGDAEQRDLAMISHLLVTGYTDAEADLFYEKAFPQEKGNRQHFRTKYAKAKTAKDSVAEVVQELQVSFSIS